MLIEQNKRLFYFTASPIIHLTLNLIMSDEEKRRGLQAMLPEQLKNISKGCLSSKCHLTAHLKNDHSSSISSSVNKSWKKLD